jgi:hypothetical protein
MQKLRFGLVLVSIVAFAVNICFWNYYYTHDVQESYDLGFLKGKDAGYRLGYSDGNQSGYQFGYSDGNYSGVQQGYVLGFNSGNLSGFQNGYDYGYNGGYGAGYTVGYSQGFKDGLGRSYNISDPTYQQTISFIATDKTNENEYSENYTCWNFVADVNNNAFRVGYRCGFVYIEFPTSAHAIVCFNTTDLGMIFIEPQDDNVMTLTVGQPYWDRARYVSPSYNDTIVRFGIIW